MATKRFGSPDADARELCRLAARAGQLIPVERGSGGGQRRDRALHPRPGRCLAIPSWQPLYLTAERGVDIFFTSDAQVLDALGLYRESDG